MIGLGMLALDLLGSGTVASGLACAPTSPASLNVQIAPGRLYSLQNVDNTAYSSLPVDTAHQILKQGILPDAVLLGCAAPGTFGFSINYLIQAVYQDLDTNLVTLPYYNASNPSQAFSGPANNGTPQATVRSGIIAINAKPGTAATTGTQTTPAPDAGFVGLWVVTVANGQTSITAGNIAASGNAPRPTQGDSRYPVKTGGQFIVSFSGPFAVAAGALINWVKYDKSVTLYFPRVIGNAGASAVSLASAPASSIPSNLIPANLGTFADPTSAFWAAAANVFTGTTPGVGINVYGEVAHVGIDNTGAIQIQKPSNWNTSGLNGVSAFSMSYQTAS